MLTKQGLFVIQDIKNQEEIIRINANGNECEKYDFIDMNDVCQSVFTKDYLIVSLENNITSFYSLTDRKKVLELNKKLHSIFVEEDNSYIYMKNKEILYRFDKQKYVIESFPIQDKDLLLSCLFDNNLIFEFKGHTLFSYKNHPLAVSLSWERDLSLIGSYTDWRGECLGSIGRVYAYKEMLIVTVGDSVLALSIDTAEVIWQIRYEYFQPLTLYIQDNQAYLAKGVFYSIIDLDKGKTILETKLRWPFGYDPEHPKKNMASVGGSLMTLHENHLYFTEIHESQHYLAKMNPKTGVIEEYQILEGISTNVGSPQFYGGNLFLLDSRNTLYIYEKE